MSASVADVPRGTYTISYVPAEYIDQIWPKVFEMVASACDMTLTPNNVYDSVKENRAVLWLVLDKSGAIVATLVTQCRQKAGNSWLEVLTMGGRDFQAWSPVMQAVLQDTSERNGCDLMRAHCRRGVAKWLKSLGWREKQVVMEYR